MSDNGHGVAAEWKAFLAALLRPSVLGLALLALLVGVSTTLDADPAVQAASVVILSMLTGLVGGLLSTTLLQAQTRRGE